MAKFKIGDKIKAKVETPYTITTNGWEGEVIRVNDPDSSDDIEVVNRAESNPTTFWVKSEYFDLVQKPKGPDEIEISLPPKIKELLINNIPELIKKGYLTEELEITSQGETKLIEILKKLLL